jgi:hypothetical protein
VLVRRRLFAHELSFARKHVERKRSGRPSAPEGQRLRVESAERLRLK